MASVAAWCFFRRAWRQRRREVRELEGRPGPCVAWRLSPRALSLPSVPGGGDVTVGVPGVRMEVVTEEGTRVTGGGAAVVTIAVVSARQPQYTVMSQ